MLIPLLIKIEQSLIAEAELRREARQTQTARNFEVKEKLKKLNKELAEFEKEQRYLRKERIITAERENKDRHNHNCSLISFAPSFLCIKGPLISRFWGI